MAKIEQKKFYVTARAVCIVQATDEGEATLKAENGDFIENKYSNEAGWEFDQFSVEPVPAESNLGDGVTAQWVGDQIRMPGFCLPRRR
jgi:hypothetical protein